MLFESMTRHVNMHNICTLEFRHTYKSARANTNVHTPSCTHERPHTRAHSYVASINQEHQGSLMLPSDFITEFCFHASTNLEETDLAFDMIAVPLYLVFVLCNM